jgi:hypothetical protein
VSQPNATQMKRINQIAMIALSPDWNGEVKNAVSALQKIFNQGSLKATDLEIVPAGSQRGGGAHNNAATESLQSQIVDLMNRLHAAHCEIANLKAARTYGFPDQRVQADLRDASNAKAERDTARRQSAKLRTILAKTEAKLDAANRVRDEAQARADAARRENDELRAALQEATAELREAHRVADVCRDATTGNGPAEVADAVTVTPTGRAEAERHRPEAAEGLADSGPFNEIAAEEQNAWNTRFNKKAVGLYWRTVRDINADLAAGLITKKQASGRKASALRNYNSGAKLGNRARTARKAA